MKIRTITTGISLDLPQETDKIKIAADFNQKAQVIFAQQGYEVQTTRIATNPWEEYLSILSPTEIVNRIQNLNISFFNIGRTYALT